MNVKTMGGGGSQTIEQTFNMDVINKSVFNQITNNQQSLSAAMNNIQKVEVNIGEMGPKCDVTLGQKIDATSQSSATMSPKTIAETKDQVQNDLQAAAQAAVEKTTEMGNMQFGDEQNVSQEVNMAIENVVEKTFETNNLNEVISEMVNMQDGLLNIKKCNGKLDFQQNIVANLMAEAITSSLTSAISENETLSALHASASGAAKTENKGLQGLITGIIDSASGPMMIGIVASVICVCVIVIAAAMFAMSPAGQNMGRAAARKF